MITPKQLEDLRSHLQTAIDVELSTVPIYLYTYYSINRAPNVPSTTEGYAISTFANKAGGILMSVAVEEMLHLSLVSNILKSLGGSPKIYGRSPASYPTNLSHHKAGFSIGLTKFTKEQLQEFMDVEKPATEKDPPQADNWDTLGQFYEYISSLIEMTEPSDYSNPEFQLDDGKNYYASSNVDTVYPKDAGYLATEKINPNDPSERGAKQAQFPNSDDSGNLKKITCKEDALRAIQIISEQGEGYLSDQTHKYDDPGSTEESHWFKYKELHDSYGSMNLTPAQLALFVHPFPDSPKTIDFPAKYQPIVELNNAVYSYLLWMTEMSFTLQGSAQSTMFYIGMHKGMIFVLDKLIGGMRYLTYENAQKETCSVSPSFENFNFSSIETAKAELVGLCEEVANNPILKLSPEILERIKDLPDINVVGNHVSFS